MKVMFSKLRFYRMRRRLSLRELAEKAGLKSKKGSISFLYHAEHGAWILSERSRKAIARVLGVKEEEIFDKYGRAIPYEEES